MGFSSDGCGDGEGDGGGRGGQSPSKSTWEKGESSGAGGGGKSHQQSWASIAKDGRKARSNERVVSLDELTRLKEVFNETLVFPKEELEEARNEWRGKTLIGKFLSRRFDPNFVARALKYKWKPKGDVEIIPTVNGFYLFRFAIEDDLLSVRSGGPTMVGGSVLALEEWRENFKPNRDYITKATIWLRMPGLPSEFWKRNFVLAIASRAGKPIEVDFCTENMLRGGFARVCVEVDLHSPLVAGTPVGPPEDQIFQEFVYEGIGLYCFRCGVIGHGLHECTCSPNGVVKIAKVVDKDGVVSGDMQTDEIPINGARDEGCDAAKVTDSDRTSDKSGVAKEVGELYGPWLSVATNRRRRPPMAGSGGAYRGGSLGSNKEFANHAQKSAGDPIIKVVNQSKAITEIPKEGGSSRDLRTEDPANLRSSLAVDFGGSGPRSVGPKLVMNKVVSKIKLVGSNNDPVSGPIFNWDNSASMMSMPAAGEMVVFSAPNTTSPSPTKAKMWLPKGNNKGGKGSMVKQVPNRFAVLSGERGGMEIDGTLDASSGGPLRRVSGDSVKRRRNSSPSRADLVEKDDGKDEDKENVNTNVQLLDISPNGMECNREQGTLGAR